MRPSGKNGQATNEKSQPQKVIGMIGGVSWESTLLYYQLINKAVREELGGLNSALLLISSINYAPIVQLEQRGAWDKVGSEIARVAKTLEEGGADFIILCCNTLHKVTPEIEASISIPFLHIADAAARLLVQAKIQRVGLLGTRFTMEDGFYASRLEGFGLSVLVPPSREFQRMDEIIYDELCQGKVVAKSKAELIRMIRELKEQGAQAVLLGCTELGMIVEQKESPIPVFDTTLLHAQEAVKRSLGLS
jgi:aspartate racemase